MTSLLDSLDPIGRDVAFSATADREDGVAVLRLEGLLGVRSVPDCREAVDRALAMRTPRLVVDLCRTRFDRESVAVLGLMRRYAARRGAALALAAVPARLLEQLERNRVIALYEIFPSVALAAGNVVASVHATCWRGRRPDSSARSPGSS